MVAYRGAVFGFASLHPCFVNGRKTFRSNAFFFLICYLPIESECSQDREEISALFLFVIGIDGPIITFSQIHVLFDDFGRVQTADPPTKQYRSNADEK